MSNQENQSQPEPSVVTDQERCSGVSFIVVDGPLEGETIHHEDFRPSVHKGTVYRKQTFAFIAVREGHKYRVWCDIAHAAKTPPNPLPGFAIHNAKCEAITDDAPDSIKAEITVDQFLEVPASGKLQQIEV